MHTTTTTTSALALYRSITFCCIEPNHDYCRLQLTTKSTNFHFHLTLPGNIVAIASDLIQSQVRVLRGYISPQMQTHRRNKTTEVEMMKEVAMSVINSNSRVIVNNSVSFSTELLLLFSPVVRSVLGSIQTPDPSSHSLYISATTTTTLVRIREILINTLSGNQQVCFYLQSTTCNHLN